MRKMTFWLKTGQLKNKDTGLRSAKCINCKTVFPLSDHEMYYAEHWACPACNEQFKIERIRSYFGGTT
jgi:rRNA maturation endonuclease Nob1